jgi:intracellular sulfur oxidation DsrE/DsrF family protein
MNDSAITGIALRNVRNHINALGADKVEIVVTHGKGIDFLLDGWKDGSGKSYETMQDLANQGVKFDVCNNALQALKIDPKTLNLNANVVPSGVAAVAELQTKGYLYIKPQVSS